ncbi:energy-coupling factor ABC transporter ATP-binding protein [Paenibacillus physcomitrellae]|uniref:Energy-coupling factor transporter ATPase n=1 Tax=Paenibacillus physcomitrellae TaxID=1619311 RepID=A0ABQ1GNY1_9BACL|nr:ABC transporter ATP-binding protein [Paenibacillus physcomitrellae]GGA47214.1 energy-coupling factor transporter ATPase [Paenibacillus physcomitrellae]
MNFPTIIFKLEQVTVDYVSDTSGKPALNEVSFEIPQGSWTAVIGDNGSGKSTLSKVLSGFIPVSGGRRVLAEGHTAYAVLQNPETQLLGETVDEELQLSLHGLTDMDALEKENRMRELLDEVGLSIPLDRPVKHLSGGQKQLLNLACCLGAGADSILFDEATSMLDPGSRKSVLEAADRLHRLGTTILWVTHRTEELCFADRILLLEQGQVSFDGTTEQFFYGQQDQEEGGYNPGVPSPCERFGYEPPYVVQTVRSLHKRGYMPQARPLFPAQLSEAVKRCQLQ